MAAASFIDILYSIRRPGRAKRGAMFKRANRAMSTLKGYQLGLGVYWLAGLGRWETQPRPFSAGERRHAGSEWRS